MLPATLDENDVGMHRDDRMTGEEVPPERLGGCDAEWQIGWWGEDEEAGGRSERRLRRESWKTESSRMHSGEISLNHRRAVQPLTLGIRGKEG